MGLGLRAFGEYLTTIPSDVNSFLYLSSQLHVIFVHVLEVTLQILNKQYNCNYSFIYGFIITFNTFLDFWKKSYIVRDHGNLQLVVT